MDLFLSVVVLAAAFAVELVNSALGMGYGTILTPLMLLLGFEPTVAIPAVLLSQGFSGLVAAFFHHRRRNVDFSFSGRSFRISLLASVLGVLATVAGALLALHVSKTLLSGYVGLLVSLVGLSLLAGFALRFTWRKISAVAVVAAFNKGISGSGFGPFLTGGQILSGVESKSAAASTLLAEAPVCLAGFSIYVLVGGLSNWTPAFLLLAGSVAAAPWGSQVLKGFEPARLRKAMGAFILVLGIWLLAKLFGLA